MSMKTGKIKSALRADTPIKQKQNGHFYTHLRLPVLDLASYQPLSESAPPYIYPAADGCIVCYLPVQRCWPALLDKGGRKS